MSAFWAAVLSERAFEVYPYPGTHGLEVAYDWNHINATAHRDYENWYGECSSPLVLCPALPLAICSAIHSLHTTLGHSAHLALSCRGCCRICLEPGPPRGNCANHWHVLLGTDDDYRAKQGWQFGGDTDNDVENVFWYTGLGMTTEFFEWRPYREMFYRFGIQPHTAFG